MAVKIRLARHGKKNFAFFHIVVADSRAPRDGRFIERIGVYNPNTNPATIELDNDKALQWLFNGAQPTETCRRILSYKGVMLRKHLQEGVKKGALTQEVADQKWSAWVEEKELKLSNKKSELAQTKREARKSAIEAEAKVKEARAEEIAKKKREEEEAVAKAAAQAAAEAAANEQPAAVEEAPAQETSETQE
ncbi:MAG: 30S ribosomal protein S16 [Bacteroidia bacterium]|jgi:small subunit ribosomal protein S16|nr:30S ribosomal protein S16 [Bacteroidia bacterium]